MMYKGCYWSEIGDSPKQGVILYKNNIKKKKRRIGLPLELFGGLTLTQNSK